MRQPQYDRTRVGAYLSLGMTFALTTAAFTLLGNVIDRKLGTTPLFTLLGVFIGGAVAFYHLYRRAVEIQESDRPDDQGDEGRSRPAGRDPDRR